MSKAVDRVILGDHGASAWAAAWAKRAGVAPLKSKSAREVGTRQRRP